MNEKPQPKWELVIAIAWHELHLYPVTNDAIEWIRDEAPALGTLDEILFNHNGSFILRLHPAYDTEEVALYLASMGDGTATQVTYRTQQIYPKAVELPPPAADPALSTSPYESE